MSIRDICEFEKGMRGVKKERGWLNVKRGGSMEGIIKESWWWRKLKEKFC